MKNVFVVRYMGMQAFSTARKAVEYIQREFPGWELRTNSSALNEQCASDVKTEHLITELNQRGYFSVSEFDVVDVEKCEVA